MLEAMLCISCLYCSLSCLHAGGTIEGITLPVLWKTSPGKTHFAVISERNSKERTLQQIYLLESETQRYTRPSTSELCSLAIKILRVLSQIHEKNVRHGALRPDVIGLWTQNDQSQVCIRD